MDQHCSWYWYYHLLPAKSLKSFALALPNWHYLCTVGCFLSLACPISYSCFLLLLVPSSFLRSTLNLISLRRPLWQDLGSNFRSLTGQGTPFCSPDSCSSSVQPCSCYTRDPTTGSHSNLELQGLHTCTGSRWGQLLGAICRHFLARPPSCNKSRHRAVLCVAACNLWSTTFAWRCTSWGLRSRSEICPFLFRDWQFCALALPTILSHWPFLSTLTILLALWAFGPDMLAKSSFRGVQACDLASRPDLKFERQSAQQAARFFPRFQCQPPIFSVQSQSSGTETCLWV